MDLSLLLSFALPLALFLISIWIFLLFLYRSLSKKITALNLHEEEDADIRHRAQNILNKAHLKSLETLYEAEKKAQEILKEAKKFNTTAEKDLTQKLDESEHQEIDAYVRDLHALQKKITQEFDQISKGFEAEAGKELDVFRKDIVQHTQKSEQVLQGQLEQEVHKAQQEIDAYKKAELEKLDSLMFQITSEVVRQVVGKTLTKTDHESIVVQALEEAKRHHVFETL